MVFMISCMPYDSSPARLGDADGSGEGYSWCICHAEGWVFDCQPLTFLRWLNVIIFYWDKNETVSLIRPVTFCGGRSGKIDSVSKYVVLLYFKKVSCIL